MIEKMKMTALALIVVVIIFFSIHAYKAVKHYQADNNESSAIMSSAARDSQLESLATLSAKLDNERIERARTDEALDDLKNETDKKLNEISLNIDRKINTFISDQNDLLDDKLTDMQNLLKGKLDQINRSKDDDDDSYNIHGKNNGNSDTGFVWVSSISQSNIEQSKASTPDTEKLTNDNDDANKLSLNETKETPYLTINKNATLMDATLMGPLIGRVPVNSHVEDPYRFKVILGKDNLAANGFDIPGLNGIIASGIAKGDMTLSCASGIIDSLTFIFPDGTISTTSSDVGDVDQLSSSNALGYIANNRNNPCIHGQFLTNANKYLVDRMAVGGIEAAGNALSMSQVTTDKDNNGTTSFLSGSMGKYIGGQVAAGGANDAAQWLRERQQNSFDVVYVQSNEDITINITKEIHIDYNVQGRKIAYENLHQTNHSTDLD